MATENLLTRQFNRTDRLIPVSAPLLCVSYLFNSNMHIVYVVQGTKLCRLPKNTWPLVIIGMSPSINFPAYSTLHISEPVFVDLLTSPRIDSHPGGPERQPYLSYRPASLHRLAKSIPRNRFLGFHKHLQIRAQHFLRALALWRDKTRFHGSVLCILHLVC
jgi:hypothetical protein